jgi:hypothetical protein
MLEAEEEGLAFVVDEHKRKASKGEQISIRNYLS